MLVPSPSVLDYHSGQLFFGSAVKSPNVTAVSRMELVSMTVSFIFKCARHGAARKVAEFYPRLNNNTGVLHPIPQDTCNISYHILFLDLFPVRNSTLSYRCWRGVGLRRTIVGVLF